MGLQAPNAVGGSASILGFGSAEIGNYRRAMTDEECASVVGTAWQVGVRYFDTAPFYGLGLSEARLGQVLSSKPRQEYRLATKVGRVLQACARGEENGGFFVNTPPGIQWCYDYSYDGVMRSYEASLERLGVSIDTLYVHDLDAYCHGSRSASNAKIEAFIDSGGWRAMDELRSSGEVSALGAGVNEWQPCVRLAELVDPDLFMLAGRYTLLEQEPLNELFPLCQARGISVMIGGPFNSGVLANGTTYNYEAAPQSVVDRVKALQQVCTNHRVPIVAAALQYPQAHPVVDRVVPGMQTVAEVQANAALCSYPIPAAFWEELKSSDLLPSNAPVPA